jgi:predicted nucleic acid-binding protein
MEGIVQVAKWDNSLAAIGRRRGALRHGYHVYDALIIAAVLEAECITFYSEDRHAGRIIDGRLTIRNPFEN